MMYKIKIDLLNPAVCENSLKFFNALFFLKTLKFSLKKFISKREANICLRGVLEKSTNQIIVKIKFSTIL